MDQYDLLNEQLTLVENHFRSLKPKYSIYLNVDESGGNYGFAKSEGKWRIVFSPDGDLESSKPITTCPAAVRINFVKRVYILRDAILGANRKFDQEIQEAVEALEAFNRTVGVTDDSR